MFNKFRSSLELHSSSPLPCSCVQHGVPNVVLIVFWGDEATRLRLTPTLPFLSSFTVQVNKY
jgi:hypothetical protein